MSFHTLSQASGFLRAAQLGVDLAGRNIAGADEEGYSRQRVDLSPTYIDFNGRRDFEVGMGVRVDGFSRVRDSFLDTAYRGHLSDVAGGEAVEALFGRLEDGFSRVDLAASATAVRTALSAAAGSPEEPGVTSEALTRLDVLASDLRGLSQELHATETESVQRHQASVKRFNEVLGELSELNVDVLLGEKTGSHNALLDTRDKLLDELSSLADIQVRIDSQHRAAVYMDGREMLFTNRAEELALDSDGNLMDQRGNLLDPGSGELKSLADFRQDTVRTRRGELDRMAQTLITEMNAVHRSGYASDGGSGRDLFSGTGAADIELVIRNPEQLALSTARMESDHALGGGRVLPDAALSGQLFSVTPSSSGVIQVNGTDVAWDDTQSLDEIGQNLAAAGVEVRFNSVSQRLLLSRAPDGNAPVDITVTDTSGNLSQVLQLTSPSYPGQDGSVAQRLSDLMGESRFDGESFEGRADALLADIGSETRQVQDETSRARNLADGALSRREQVNGVSVDEELLNLTRFQKSFQAAARLATVADEMISTVLQMGAR